MKPVVPKRINGKLVRRMRLRGFSPEQKRQRQIEQTREWQLRHPEKSRASGKTYRQKLRARSQFGENAIKFRKPFYKCVACLHKIGFTLSFISKKLHMTYGNVGVTISRIGVGGKRIPSRLSRGGDKRGPRPKTEKMVLRLMTRSQQKELKALARFDESNHWRTHPERVIWSNENSRRTKYEARLAKFLSKFKCKGCGCDASMFTPEKRRFGIKFCSDKCYSKFQLARIQSDPQLWQRRREIAKKCYDRTCRERPEVIKAQVRRHLANPINRIIRSHRLQIYLLVKGGFMIKTRSSVEYLGCSPLFLKQHLESQFKSGMTWDNYGSVWHVDHIFPLRPPKTHSIDLTDPNICARLFNYKNLRPMFGGENRSKSNKIIYELVSLPLSAN